MLDEEIRFYQNNLNTWLSQHRDRVVLIKGSQSVGFFDTEKDAIDAGARLEVYPKSWVQYRYWGYDHLH